MTGPVNAIRSCLRQYVGFSGRAPRSEFWWWSICAGLVLVIVLMVLLGLEETDLESADPDADSGSIAVTILWIALFIPSLAVTVRRLHDTDWSGWWALSTMLCGAVPVYAAAFGAFALGVLASTAVLLPYLAASAVSLIVFVRMFFPGTRGDNRFGADPLAGTDGEGDVA